MTGMTAIGGGTRTGLATLPAEPRRITEIEREMAGLDAVISALESQRHEIASRLDGVTRKEPVGAGNDKAAEDPSTEFGKSLRVKANGLWTIHSAYAAILTTLEL